MASYAKISNPQFEKEITEEQKNKITESIRIFMIFDESVIRKYIFNLITDTEFALNKMKLYPIYEYKKYINNIYMEIINNKPELIPQIPEDSILTKLQETFGDNPFVLFRIVELKNNFLILNINKKSKLSILNNLTSKNYKTQKESYMKLGFNSHEIQYFMNESKLIVKYIKIQMRKKDKDN